MTGDYYDSLETRDPEVRERALFQSLCGQVRHAQVATPFYAELLAGIEPGDVRDRAALARLPVTRKSDLIERQKQTPPFGGLNATPTGRLSRIFASPGPIFDPEGRGVDYWRFARALYATGFRSGDVLHNCFAYHFTPAGSMFESAAHALGCAVFPAGTGNTELQVEAIAAVRPRGYAGTPDFLKIILEKADALSVDLSFLKIGHVTGGAFLPDVKNFYRDRGLQVLQSYGTADLGMVAYESPAREGLILDEQVIVEIVRPGTGDPVSDGEVGEIIVTVLNPDYPLIRFATGDMSAILPGNSPCGRTNRRIKGWMGRADQSTKVKGMFVHPKQVADILCRHPEIAQARLVVEREDANDIMTLRCEVATPVEGLADAIGRSINDIAKLKGAVELCPPGSLPNDGKVIDDTRS
jgi:phenylacetate-CoA ligase